MRRSCLVALCLLLAGVTACVGDGNGLPTPVALTPAVTGEPTPSLPEVESFNGSSVTTGRLNGGVYVIEVPENWNKRLVMFIRGGQEGFGSPIAPEVRGFSLRWYLLEQGYAWATTSLDQTGIITGAAADQTAALWDHFVAEFERPKRTYVVGASMGGAGAIISAERYADRYDGVLSQCGISGERDDYETAVLYDLAGAYVLGVTQEEFESTPIIDLVFDRIVPHLYEDDVAWERTRALWVRLTGGDRPFALEGLELRRRALQDLGRIRIEDGVVDNTDTVYELRGSYEQEIESFNRRVLRIEGEAADDIPESEEFSGNIKIPVLTLHTTGDGIVPISHLQTIQRRVDAAGQSDLLVQRTLREPAHCRFEEVEEEEAFRDLVQWVEDGRKPAGDDVLADDLMSLGAEFTWPRWGSPEADAVPGADERKTLTGTITFNGESVASEVGPDDTTLRRLFTVLVERDGLLTVCNLDGENPSITGEFTRTVAGQSEMHGCATDDADIWFALYSEVDLVLEGPVRWSGLGSSSTVDVDFDYSSYKRISSFYGPVFDSDGELMPGGTQIEAFIGDTLCGRSSVAHTGVYPGNYIMYVVGESSVDGCLKNGTIRFVVNGEEVPQTGTNTLDDSDSEFLELTMR